MAKPEQQQQLQQLSDQYRDLESGWFINTSFTLAHLLTYKRQNCKETYQHDKN